jgi:ribonucleoside-diphosphate reductase beta chain
MNSDEPLLQNTQQKLTIFPIEYQKIWKFYQKQLSCFWTTGEVNLNSDKFDELTESEQHFLKYILAFFAASDGIVNMNLDLNFSQDFNIQEVKFNYHFQMMMEDIHSTMYSILIDTYIKSSEEKHVLFNAIHKIPCIKRKADWAFKWISSDVSLGRRLIAFSIVEGIYFSGAFCAIYWFSTKNKMPGLCKSNEFIARDEGLHTDFACLLYEYIVNKVPEEEVHSMIKEAVEIEEEFINKSLKCSLIGMNAAAMTQYIYFVADRLVVNLGYSKIYNAKNPFKFMEQIGLEGKNNFFEDRTSEYQKANVIESKDNIFNVAENDDF